MTHKEVWRYGAMKAVLRVAPTGLIEIDVTGLVGLSGLALIRRDAITAMRLPGARAMLVDMRRASVLAGVSAVPMTDAPPVPNELMGMPVSIVCSTIDEPLFLAHAWSQAEKGLVRAVFTDREAASSWVLERAQGSSLWGMVQ